MAADLCTVPCRHYTGAQRGRCGGIPTRRYINGARCRQHTPAAVRCLPEPGCSPACGPVMACRCPQGLHWEWLDRLVSTGHRNP